MTAAERSLFSLSPSLPSLRYLGRHRYLREEEENLRGASDRVCRKDEDEDEDEDGEVRTGGFGFA